MSLDAAVAAVAVRTTARLSAVLLTMNLIVAAWRLSAGPDPTLPPRLFQVRTLDTSTFAAFLVSHTIHFGCVALLSFATSGATINNSGGWTTAVVVAALFYLGGWAVFRIKQRSTQGWVGTRQRFREMTVLTIVWMVFFLGFLGRSTGSLLYGSLTIALLVSIALFAVAGVRSPIARAGSGKPQSV